MSDLRTAAQQALEALDQLTDAVDGTGFSSKPSFTFALDTIDALRAALASNPAPGYCTLCKQYTIEEQLPAPAAVAEPVATGFKLVPLEPTPEMAKAGCYRYCAAFVKDYKAMIAAATVAPPQRDRCWACGNTGSVTTSSNGSGLIKVPCEDCAPKEKA